MSHAGHGFTTSRLRKPALTTLLHRLVGWLDAIWLAAAFPASELACHRIDHPS